MPRKTRKQKIKSSQRAGRGDLTAQEKVPASISVQLPQIKTKPAELLKIQQGDVSEDATQDPLRSQTLRDVIKTAVVISIIFIAQAGVYLASKR